MMYFLADLRARTPTAGMKFPNFDRDLFLFRSSIDMVLIILLPILYALLEDIIYYTIILHDYAKTTSIQCNM